jgi:pyridoxine 4-dehydrogenase
VALSWLLHRAPNILPIPGTTSIAHLEENVAAAKLSPTQDQLLQLASVAGREN